MAHFNEIHFSAAWSRLGHLAESCATERGWLAANPSATSALQRDTLKRLGRIEKQAPRALSAIAHGAARAEGVRSYQMLSAIAQPAVENVQRLTPSDIANLCGAYATARARPEGLFSSISQHLFPVGGGVGGRVGVGWGRERTWSWERSSGSNSVEGQKSISTMR